MSRGSLLGCCCCSRSMADMDADDTHDDQYYEDHEQYDDGDDGDEYHDADAEYEHEDEHEEPIAPGTKISVSLDRCEWLATKC